MQTCHLTGETLESNIIHLQTKNSFHGCDSYHLEDCFIHCFTNEKNLIEYIKQQNKGIIHFGEVDCMTGQPLKEWLNNVIKYSEKYGFRIGNTIKQSSIEAIPGKLYLLGSEGLNDIKNYGSLEKILKPYILNDVILTGWIGFFKIFEKQKMMEKQIKKVKTLSIDDNRKYEIIQEIKLKSGYKRLKSKKIHYAIKIYIDNLRFEKKYKNSYWEIFLGKDGLYCREIDKIYFELSNKKYRNFVYYSNENDEHRYFEYSKQSLVFGRYFDCPKGNYSDYEEVFI